MEYRSCANTSEMYRNIRLTFEKKILRSVSRIIHYYWCFEFFVFTKLEYRFCTSLSWATSQARRNIRLVFRRRFHRREDRSKIRVWERESGRNEPRARPKSVLNEGKWKAKAMAELDDGFRAFEQKRGKVATTLTEGR